MKTIQAFLTSKKLLIIFSIVALLTAFFLALFSQKNQISNYFKTPPKTHSVITFQAQNPQNVSQNDILTGKGIPNASVKIVISPNGETKEVQTDDKGNWNYTIPKNIKRGIYNLTVFVQDRFSKIASTKRYTLDLTTNPKKTLLNFLKFNLISKVYAEGPPSCTPDLSQYLETKCFEGQRCMDTFTQDPNSCLWSPMIDEKGDYTYCLSDSACSNPSLGPCPYEEKQLTYSCEEGQRCYYQYYRMKTTNCRWQQGNFDRPGQATKCVSDLNCGVKTTPGTSGTGRVGIDEEFQRLVGDNWLQWLLALQRRGVFPAIQNGEVVYYSRDAFKETFCKDKASCATDIVEYTQDDWNKVFETDKRFFADVLNEAHQRGCYSFDFLESYFPAFQNLNPAAFIELGPRPECPDGNINEDETQLMGILQTEAIAKSYGQKEPLLNMLNMFEPFVGTRSIYNVVTGYELTGDEDRLNAALGILILAPAIKTASSVGLDAVKGGINSVEALTRGNEFRELLRTSYGGVPQGAVDQAIVRPGAYAGIKLPTYIPAKGGKFGVVGRVKDWYDVNWYRNSRGQMVNDVDRILGDPTFPVGARLERSGSFPKPSFLPDFPTWLDFERIVMGQLKNGLGAVVSREDVLKPAASNLRRAIYNFQNETGKSFSIADNNLQRLTSDGVAYVVRDMKGKFAGVYSPAGNYIIYRESSYYSPYGLNVIHHEITHMASGKYKGWIYGGPTIKDRILTGIYELVTDAWSSKAQGIDIFSPRSALQTGGYKNRTYPVLYKRLADISNGQPNVLNNFLEFALNPDADNLVSNIFGYKQAASFMDKIQGKTWVPNFDAFKEYFKRSKGINFAAISLTASTMATTDSEEEPVGDIEIELGDDFLTDDYKENPINYVVNINQISSQDNPFKPESGIDVTALISSDNGEAVDLTNLNLTWTLISAYQTTANSLSEVTPLTGGEKCKESCQIILPPELESGTYKLVAYLTREGNDEILATGISDPIVIEASTEPVITSVTIGDQTIGADNLEQTINFTLSGTEGEEGTFEIPVTVNFSNNTTRYLGVTFNYQPDLPAVPCPEPYFQCGGTLGLEDQISTHLFEITPVCNEKGEVLNYQKNDLENSTDCGWVPPDETPQENPAEPPQDVNEPGSQPDSEPNPEPQSQSCPSPYPQCGGTVGLENYDTSETVLVTPLCDGSGNIIDYDKSPQGDRGECCENQYFFDEAYQTCVHKYSPDAYPNCYYLFDSVDSNFCP